MTHNRACPVCSKIVEWTKGEKKTHTMYSGDEITSYSMHLICPEHGEFEPRAHEQLNRDLSSVMKELGK